MLHDRDGFLQETLAKFKARLDRLRAWRIWRGNAWFWDLKPITFQITQYQVRSGTLPRRDLWVRLPGQGRGKPYPYNRALFERYWI